ncbi:hypothetical protein RclHR1_01520001 [Rhizophagus clarus]|uniref:Uncharacterized protein n=1 Tax=Rhizophagus clarus TaxID=94130 RepID=A0A2Z6R746_9GLOM|nr:hypothetical protein RclHR1_01520001 [Rhizophagus clarus]GES78737.1 hypothetical protein RCL_e2927_RclHR1_01520001 [Rhizophagus clarus]
MWEHYQAVVLWWEHPVPPVPTVPSRISILYYCVEHFSHYSLIHLIPLQGTARQKKIMEFLDLIKLPPHIYISTNIITTTTFSTSLSRLSSTF